MGELLKLIQRAANTYNQDTMYTLVCEVVSIDQDTLTCVVDAISGESADTIEGDNYAKDIFGYGENNNKYENKKLRLENVTLMQGVNDGFLLIPTVGSQVQVIYSNKHQPFIVQYSEVDIFQITIGDTILKYDKDAYQFEIEKTTVLIDNKSLTFKTDENNGSLVVDEKGVSISAKSESTKQTITEDGFKFEKGGESITKIMQDLLQLLMTQTFTNGAGTTSPTNNVADFQQLLQRINDILK